MKRKVLHTLLLLFVTINTAWLPGSVTAAVMLDELSPQAAEQPATGAADNSPVWTRWHPDQYTLAEDSESLWIGAAGGVIRWNKATQRYRRYSRLNGLPQQNVYAVAVDGAGNRWFGGDGGLSRLDAANQWRHFTSANSGLYNNLVDGLAVADDTTLWLSHGLPAGPVSRRSPDGTWRAYPNLAAAVVLDYAQILTTHNPNPLWAVAGSEVWVGYWVYNGVQWINRTPVNGSAQPKALVVADNQQLWALDGSVRSWDGATWTDVAAGRTYTALAVGPDQTLWGGGLVYNLPFSIALAAIGQVLHPDSLHSLNRLTPVTALLPAANGVWAVGAGWLLQPDGTLTDLPDVPAFTGVNDALLDQQGHLQLYSRHTSFSCNDGAFQTLDDRGDALLDNDGWTLDNTGYGNLTAFGKAPSGDLWAVWEGSCRAPVYSGPQRYHQGAWRSAGFAYPDDPYPPHISDIFIQDDQHLWFAYQRTTPSYTVVSGVVALDDRGTPTDLSDDRWRDYPITPESAAGSVVVDSLGRLWLGNSNGLHRYTGQSWQLISDEYPVAQGICDLVTTPDGTLYAQGAILYGCAGDDSSILRVAPDGTMTTPYLHQVIQDNFSQVQATTQRNQLWSVAPDGAVWYISATYETYPPEAKELHRRTAAGQTDYALPVKRSTVQTLVVDANNHVWLVADGSLWRMTTSRPTFTLTAQPNVWLLTPNASRPGMVRVDGYEGFNETIALDLHGLPRGATATLVPSAVSAGQDATLTLTTAADLIPGVYPLSLVGTSETLTQSIPLTMVVVSELFDLYLPTVAR